MSAKLFLIPALGAVAWFGYQQMNRSEADKIIAADPQFADKIAGINEDRVTAGKPPLTDAQIVNRRADEIGTQLIASYPALKTEIDRRNENRVKRGQRKLRGKAIMKIAQDMAAEGKLHS